MQINYLKKIQIFNMMFRIKYDPESFGGSFNYNDSEIIIGTKDKDVGYILGIISHELLEILSIELGIRYRKPLSEDYLFVADHAQFTSLTNAHAGLLSKFIKNS